MSNISTTTTALASSEPTDAGSTARTASEHDERGRGHGLEFILYLMEQRLVVLLAVPTVIAAIVTWGTRTGALTFALTWLAVPLCGVVLPLIYLIIRSHGHDDGPADWTPYIAFRDSREAARWTGKKIPMEVLYEAYMAERVDFRQDLLETMLRRNGLFRFCFTFGDVKFYFGQFLFQKLWHSKKADQGDIAPVYDRGNDFYGWFLGESMVYTSGVFRDQSETLEEAQNRKLETICQSVQMKPGDRHLDIGCGWGTLINHAASKYGTQSTGITLSKEQRDYATAKSETLGTTDRIKIIVDDYRNLPSQKFDKITCVEMAEHVGVKNFQKFLLQVRGMLEDDGIFYLQIAGLRRPWEYEDLVWGLFMGKYIFPGADASCPLGFVTSQAERAGFEVHRVENCGAHYSVTIHKWYDNWKANEAAIVAKYGQRWYRMWLMFLGWSVIIGAQGSSTLFMVTLTKNIKNDKSSVAADEAKRVAFSRADRWIGKNPVATQQ